MAVPVKTVLVYPIPELENCQNKEGCKQYCQASEHYLVCADFGEKNNLITKEEAVRAKKLVTVLQSKGPGGCQGEVACKNYCNKTGNQKECFNFSMTNGLISAEKLKEINAGMAQLRSGLKQLPPEMKNCLIKKVGAGIVSKIEGGKGETIDLVEIGGALQNCATSFSRALRPAGAVSAEMPNCVKSIISTLSEKMTGGAVPDQSEFMSAMMHSCLPPGTKIPPGALTGFNAEALKKMQEKMSESGQYGKIELPEITGDGSGMGR